MKQLCIVDDDENLTRVLARRFESTGNWQVRTFACPEALLAQPDQFIEAILLDMMLGNSKVGLDYLAALKQNFGPEHLIMMSGYASVATTVEALRLGATDYVTKPVGFAELQARLENLSSAVNSPSLTPMTPAQAEWEHIQRVLLSHQGNISATAKALGMHRRTLQRKLQKHSPNKA